MNLLQTRSWELFVENYFKIKDVIPSVILSVCEWSGVCVCEWIPNFFFLNFFFLNFFSSFFSWQLNYLLSIENWYIEVEKDTEYYITSQHTIYYSTDTKLTVRRHFCLGKRRKTIFLHSNIHVITYKYST